MLWFINCGGMLDLTEKWFISETHSTEVFLLDVNKPINHANINHKRIFVVDDGQSDFGNCPTKEEVEDLRELWEMELEDSEEE